MPSDAPKYAEPMVVKNHDTSDTHSRNVGVAAAGIARAPTPLPAKQLLLLCLTVFCEPLNILTPFPFVVFMVRDASDLERERSKSRSLISAAGRGLRHRRGQRGPLRRPAVGELRCRADHHVRTLARLSHAIPTNTASSLLPCTSPSLIRAPRTARFHGAGCRIGSGADPRCCAASSAPRPPSCASASRRTTPGPWPPVHRQDS